MSRNGEYYVPTLGEVAAVAAAIHARGEEAKINTIAHVLGANPETVRSRRARLIIDRAWPVPLSKREQTRRAHGHRASPAPVDTDEREESPRSPVAEIDAAISAYDRAWTRIRRMRNEFAAQAAAEQIREALAC